MIPVYEGMKGLIFDCDGTLADTMTIHTHSWQETLKHFGHDCPVDFLRPLRGIPAEEIVIHFNRTFETDLNPRDVSAAKNQMSYDRLKTVKPIMPVLVGVSGFVFVSGTLFKEGEDAKTSGVVGTD